MELNELRPAAGAVRNKKRIGRGPGSGHGKTATKGHKGQKARSGGSVKPGFEGGQMPMQRRLPKRGFTPLTKRVFSVVNVGQLNVFDAGSCIDADALIAAGLIKSVMDGVKVLADGELTKSFTVKAHCFSEKAKEKIAAVGGFVEEIER